MPLDPKLRDDIIAAVDKGFDAQVKFTQDMVRHVSTRGNEHTMQDFMFRAMKARGYKMERFEMDRAALKHIPAPALGTNCIRPRQSSSPRITRARRRAVR